MLTLDVNIGEPVTRGALTFFPLLAPSSPDGDYVAGPVADEKGLLDFTELNEAAAVSELLITNRGQMPVLIIEGETLRGAKQHRTINVSVLLPAAERSVVDVSCIEAGRWSSETPMGRAGYHAPSSLRRSKTESVSMARRLHGSAKSDQGRVWEEVDDAAERLDAPSESASLLHVYDTREQSLSDLVDDLDPEPDQVGVVVAVGDEVRGLDSFDRADTFAAYWPSLRAGYAVDGLDVEAADVIPATAQEFLDAVRHATTEETEATALGREVHISSEGLTAIALEWKGIVRHVSAFRIGAGDEVPVAG